MPRSCWSFLDSVYLRDSRNSVTRRRSAVSPSGTSPPRSHRNKKEKAESLYLVLVLCTSPPPLHGSSLNSRRDMAADWLPLDGSPRHRGTRTPPLRKQSPVCPSRRLCRVGRYAVSAPLLCRDGRSLRAKATEADVESRYRRRSRPSAHHEAKETKELGCQGKQCAYLIDGCAKTPYQASTPAS